MGIDLAFELSACHWCAIWTQSVSFEWKNDTIWNIPCYKTFQNYLLFLSAISACYVSMYDADTLTYYCFPYKLNHNGFVTAVV